MDLTLNFVNFSSRKHVCRGWSSNSAAVRSMALPSRRHCRSTLRLFRHIQSSRSEFQRYHLIGNGLTSSVVIWVLFCIRFLRCDGVHTDVDSQSKSRGHHVPVRCRCGSRWKQSSHVSSRLLANQLHGNNSILLELFNIDLIVIKQIEWGRIKREGSSVIGPLIWLMSLLFRTELQARWMSIV